MTAACPIYVAVTAVLNCRPFHLAYGIILVVLTILTKHIGLPCVDIVRQGKALYIGISNYPLEVLDFTFRYLRERDVPCLIYQGRYNMIDRRTGKPCFFHSGDYKNR